MHREEKGVERSMDKEEKRVERGIKRCGEVLLTWNTQVFENINGNLKEKRK